VDGGAGITVAEAAIEATAPSCDPSLVIDDMTTAAGPTTTGGYWYTYSDRTCVSKLPAELRPDAAGELDPAEGDQYLSMIGPGDGPDPCGTGAMPYRDLKGGDENNWGAGMGFDLADTALSSPFTLAADQVLGVSCAGPEACTGTPSPNAYRPPPSDAGAGGTFAEPFDASRYSGIRFYVRAPGATGPVKVKVQLSDKSTNPAGGMCDQCLYGGPSVDGGVRCADDFLKTLPFTSTWTWTEVRLMFDDPLLKTVGWSNKMVPRPSSAMDLKSIYYLHFQISTSDYPAPVKAFHIQVGYVAWIPK
jgi:hypothetical protein